MCIGEEQKEVWGVLKLINEESTDGEVPTERNRTESQLEDGEINMREKDKDNERKKLKTDIREERRGPNSIICG